jgi:hypothetical protein
MRAFQISHVKDAVFSLAHPSREESYGLSAGKLDHLYMYMYNYWMEARTKYFPFQADSVHVSW